MALVNGEAVAYRNWLPHKPSEHLSGQDYGTLFAEGRGQIDPDKLSASMWKDLGLYGAAKGYVIEFE